MSAPSNPVHHERTTVSGTGTDLSFLELVGRTESSHARFPLGEHDHASAFEICYLRRGSQTFVVGGERYTIRGGEFFITYPGERHSSGGEPLEKSALYWMIVDPSAAHACSTEAAGGLALIVSVFRELERKAVRTAVASSRVEVHFDAIFAAWDETSPSRTAKIVHSVLSVALAFLESADADLRTTVSPEIHRVSEAIRNAPELRLGIDELADIAGLSGSHLRTRFEAELGMPPTEFANRIRVDQAKRRLTAGESVTDVAFALGFPSSQYFATVFKQFTGKRPSEYG